MATRARVVFAGVTAATVAATYVAVEVGLAATGGCTVVGTDPDRAGAFCVENRGLGPAWLRGYMVTHAVDGRQVHSEAFPQGRVVPAGHRVHLALPQAGPGLPAQEDLRCAVSFQNRLPPGALPWPLEDVFNPVTSATADDAL
jgi:hypothetical protein